MIKSILLKPFGHFSHRKFYFTSGVNLIYAENEKGKTTLFMALQAALLGFIPAGQRYPYFPWDGQELYLEAELFDGRIIRRRITSSVSGFLEEGEEVIALANRPLDELSRSYVENFHLLQAEDLYELEQSRIDEIIEENMEKLYAGDGPSYQSILKLLGEKQREIYKKRGRNYLLYEIEEELGLIRSKDLRKREAINGYEEKSKVLQQMKVRINMERTIKEPLNAKLATSQGYKSYEEGKKLEKTLKEKNSELKILHSEIAAQSSELSELHRLEELKRSLQTVNNRFVMPLILSIIMFSTFISVYLIDHYSPHLLAAVGALLSSFLFALGWRKHMNTEKKELIKAGFFSKEDFLESYKLQKELSFSLDELLDKKSRIQEEINFLEKEQQDLLKKLESYGPLGLEGLKQDLDIIEKQSPRDKLLEEDYNRLQLELLRLKDIIDMPLEDYEELKNKKDDLLEEYNRYIILEGLIKASYENYRQELLPKILKLASYYFRVFTAEEYQGVLNSPQGELYLQREKDNLLLSSSMSKGLRSQFYLALRLAVTEILGQDIPLFFDEAFSNWDEKRLGPTLELLQELPRQQFIFTCKKRDAVLFEKLLRIKAMEL
ncbi:MAG: AAA family ATPase [Tissierellia bacterium]|nr:AAA family ATPase [Tissierellia bacterium]